MSETQEKRSAADLWGEIGRLKVHPPMLSAAGQHAWVRRMDIEALLMSPRLPGPLLEKVINYFKELDSSEGETGKERMPFSLKTLPVKQAAQMPDVVNAVLIHTLDGPFGVIGDADPSKNQVDVTRMPDKDRMFLFEGAMSNWPELPVKTEGGEVRLTDLAEFPPVGGGDAGATSVAGVSQTAQ
jgi:hypothetical protein